MPSNFNKIWGELKEMRKEQNQTKRNKLRQCDLFVLDNSIRETTVGQLRGHTLENKIKIFEEAKKCGFTNLIVASFNHMTRVGDTFCRYLVDNGEDMSNLWSFSEITEVWGEVLDTEKIPISLRKMKEFGIHNVVFEIDTADPKIDWDGKFTVEDLCQLLLKRYKWCYENLGQHAKILVSFRDFAFSMNNRKGAMRTLRVVEFLGTLPQGLRGFGMCFEEPGKFLPEVVGGWCAAVRQVMDESNWPDGHLLVHLHKRWGFAQINQLECLMNGADGVWAGVCEEGASMGHASSTMTIMNLIRMGNRKVLRKYNCTYLRKAAINVTQITTGMPPHFRELIYGERALDLWLPGDDDTLDREFNLAEFFDEPAPNRITDLTSPQMIVDRLVNCFGPNPAFKEDRALKMKELLLADMSNGIKVEYMSKVGIALLFDRAGGQLTEAMSDSIRQMKLKDPHDQVLLNEVRAMWDEWDVREEVQGDNSLEFDSFYNGFMAPYFGCFRCEDTKKGLKALDMDNDLTVDWKEFEVYLKWALHEYPEITNADQLLSYAFRKAIIPAMQDEKVNQAKEAAKSGQQQMEEEE